MQTFLPYPSFARSARVLDDRRLGKQRVEVLQVLRALHFPTYGWRDHVVVRMWRGFVPALVLYGERVCEEWDRRGWKDSCAAQIAEFRARDEPATLAALAEAGALPPWLGSRALHRSHRSKLIQKDPGFYRPRFPGVPDDLPYVWPASEVAEPPEPALTAWVVRPAAPVRRLATAPGRVHRVRFALPVETGHLTRRRRRQAEHDLAAARTGDTVLVARDHELVIGTLERLSRPRAGGITLELRSRGTAPRQALRRPGLLQDPRPFFALRGEALPH
jgi:hypothetical protein